MAAAILLSRPHAVNPWEHYRIAFYLLNHSEQLGEQLELAGRASVVGRTDLAKWWNINGLVGGPARIRA